ncbi:signal peptidase I [Anaerocolumna sp. MB42-C2]|uniref:signal peptidase I n=1 Tax=Anaerocolumna sp. MB42-C2 TaxID=3070997 RepID=UPI0027E095F3|nr:signal peptidase I [Anaerocolumna sp. MB42-C2]WMJ90350.1 signal peptidase I [Anaerocolumna sp. MB42-C2]
MTDIKKEIFEWAKVIVIAIAIAFILNNYVIVNAQVPTGSMENTVMTKDRIFAFRLAYLFEDPQRGDIVVFPFPDDEKVNYLKRIIGLPGDTVEIKDGKVYINNSKKPLKEDYLKETPTGSFGPYKVPEDSYFMMGDNRNISEDSRYWNNPYVKKEKILGKAIIRYYPSIKSLK